MIIIKKVSPLQLYLRAEKERGKQVGFVPTMGALHRGHLSLVKQAQMENDICVCSIFVNPTQFNDVSDFDHYPRTITEDIEKLEEAGVEVIFVPEVKEMYPGGVLTKTDVDFSGLDAILEGGHRPGHFGGVATIVEKLLEAVKPHTLYLGQKDFQQYLIIQKLVEQRPQINVEVKICPVIREKNGLAMSSRNVRLSESERSDAAVIYKALQYAKEKLGQIPVDDIKSNAVQMIKSSPAIKSVDYFEIMDAESMKSINSETEAPNVIALTAVNTSAVRLIDNLLLKGSLPGLAN